MPRRSRPSAGISIADGQHARAEPGSDGRGHQRPPGFDTGHQVDAGGEVGQRIDHRAHRRPVGEQRGEVLELDSRLRKIGHVAGQRRDEVGQRRVLSNTRHCIKAHRSMFQPAPQRVGFVLTAFGAGTLATIQLPGQINDGLSGMTPGKAVFLAHSGNWTHTVPTTGANQFLGYALSPTQLIFQPGPDQLL